MANCAISSVQRDGTVKNVLVTDDHSRIADQHEDAVHGDPAQPGD
jgi:hypothetical protein